MISYLSVRRWILFTDSEKEAQGTSEIPQFSPWQLFPSLGPGLLFDTDPCFISNVEHSAQPIMDISQIFFNKNVNECFAKATDVV